MRLWMAAIALVVAACSSTTTSPPADTDLPTIDGPGIRAVLADLEHPAVVNVWASWCLPCRSEAPLLAEAHQRLGDQVRFIGIDVQDERESARQFIAEFDLDFEHFFDPDRAVPSELGGFGTPITYFVAAGGQVVDIHSGILDEQTLALMIDELMS